MSTKSATRKVARCDRCCPDGGAIFYRDVDDNLKPAWKCQNCHHTKPCRMLKPLQEPTVKMVQIIDRLSHAFGGTKTVEMIGRQAFVILNNEFRSLYNGRSAYGTVSTNGRFRLTVQRIGGDVVVKDEWQIEAYLERYNPSVAVKFA